MKKLVPQRLKRTTRNKKLIAPKNEPPIDPAIQIVNFCINFAAILIKDEPAKPYTAPAYAKNGVLILNAIIEKNPRFLQDLNDFLSKRN